MRRILGELIALAFVWAFAVAEWALAVKLYQWNDNRLRARYARQREGGTVTMMKKEVSALGTLARSKNHLIRSVKRLDHQLRAENATEDFREAARLAISRLYYVDWKKGE